MGKGRDEKIKIRSTRNSHATLLLSKRPMESPLEIYYIKYTFQFLLMLNQKQI